MNEPAGGTSWKAVLLVIGGILLALLLAALLSQMDLLQKRRILPTERLQIIDLEATISAGEVTLINLSGDVGVELATPPAAAEEDAVTVTRAGTAVPVFAPTCAAAPSGWSLYTVQEGDSLSSLATQFDITVEELRLANCLNETGEFVAGQRLFVKQSLPTAAPEQTPDCTIPTGWSLHVVTADETLAALAVERNTTISLILRVNCLTEESIAAGTGLYLPSLTPPATSPTATPLLITRQPTATRASATATRTSAPATMTRPLPTPTRSSTIPPTAAPNPAAVTTRTPSTALNLPLPVTATVTATLSPTVAATWTSTVTASPIAISSPTASTTVTPSVTASATPTATPKPPATATLAPSYPPGGTATPLPSATPSSTPTATPTLEPYPA